MKKDGSKIFTKPVLDYMIRRLEFMGEICDNALDNKSSFEERKKKYKEIRTKYADLAETINDESWVMRNLWDTRVAQGRGLVTIPKKLTSLGVKRLMERAIWAQGLRKKLEPGKKRHPFQANHSLRKWFKTRCEIAGMKPIFVKTVRSKNRVKFDTQTLRLVLPLRYKRTSCFSSKVVSIKYSLVSGVHYLIILQLVS